MYFETAYWTVSHAKGNLFHYLKYVYLLVVKVFYKEHGLLLNTCTDSQKSS